ncbi:MAG: hypothetical protein AAF618_08920, partial [Pseudomonadota bacterium]
MSETTASLTHGALRAELRFVEAGVEPTIELRFVESATGAVLLAEEKPHILYPNARNYDAEAGDLWKIEAHFA